MKNKKWLQVVGGVVLVLVLLANAGFSPWATQKTLDEWYGQLEEENKRLKRMMTDLSLDKQMLQDVLSKKL